jgi:uncharacterized protein with GYD domain
MVTYISLVNWTDQGIKSVEESPKRVEAVRQLAVRFGCEVKSFHLTIGQYDMVLMLEAPDDESATKLLLSVASGGNVRTTTLRAFPEEEYRSIVDGLATLYLT